MLVREDAGSAEDYPTLIFLLNRGGQHLQDIMVEPTHMRVEQRKCYRFVLAGFVIIITVSSLPMKDPMSRFVLSPNAPVRSYDSELREFAFLRAVEDRVAETTKNVIL